MKVVEGRDARMILLGRMVDIRSNQDFSQLETLAAWTMMDGVSWTLFEMEHPIPLELHEYWIRDHGRWDHGFSGKMCEHNMLGMAYAQLVTMNGNIQDFKLLDRPDFTGNIDGVPVVGDIGKCSVGTFIDSMRRLSENGIWISVIDAQTQVILEFNFPIGQTIIEHANDIMKASMQ